METTRIPPLSPGSDIKIFASPTWYTHRVWDFPIVLLSLCLTARRPANKLYFRDPRKIPDEGETIQPLDNTPLRNPRHVISLLIIRRPTSHARGVFEFLLYECSGFSFSLEYRSNEQKEGGKMTLDKWIQDLSILTFLFLEKIQWGEWLVLFLPSFFLSFFLRYSSEYS